MRNQPAVSRGGERAQRRPPWRPRRRLALALLTAIVVALIAVTLPLFVWPPQGSPARVDAIIMLNGPGDRLHTAELLAWSHRAPFLVVSSNSRFPGSSCAAKIPGVMVICFDPRPSTTRGEAEFIGRLAQRYRWRTVVLVTITPQITPGRIWLNRCMSARVYAVAAPLRGWAWPLLVAYEWGATIRAEVFHRVC